ncbi:hypothetical protein [Gelidibacter salicanalis]|uniref:Uncharacterized protein n=1 Tax=Gelidibacter salicanalis TaxID=291193 RepID=A0A934KZ14_9FLAO|nr:hypothetical protein [Gelidibacter salicanalis]MBJ7881995.1 hypothetical protein [Gelidibacter salicanalis]
MTTDGKAQDQEKTPEEIKLEQEAVIAALKDQIAQSELAAAQAYNTIQTSIAAANEKAKSESEKAKSEAQAAAITAKRELFKGPEVNSLEGNITSSGDFIESNILSLRSLNIAFEQLYKKLNDDDFFHNKTLQFVIYDDVGIQGLE